MRQVAKKGLITVVATGGVLAVTGGYAYADAGAVGAASGSPGVLSGNTVQVPVHAPVNICGNTVDVVGALNPAFGNNCSNDSRGVGGGAVGGGAVARGGSAHSPGVGSGNTVQVPVHVPVNACDDSVDVVGALNPAFGDNCANDSRGVGGGGVGGSGARGGSVDSPGVGSGNTIQVPVHVPVNACGDTVGVIGVLNPVFGNSCGNGSTPVRPGQPVQTPPLRSRPAKPHPHPHRPAPRHAKPPTRGHQPPTLAHTGVDQLGGIAAASAGMLIGGFVLYRRSRASRR